MVPAVYVMLLQSLEDEERRARRSERAAETGTLRGRRRCDRDHYGGDGRRPEVANGKR